MSSFAGPLQQIKADLSRAVPASLVRQVADVLHVEGRERVLTPVVTTHLALLRALHGGTAISHLRHLSGIDFTPSAYCQALARLPEAFLPLLQIALTGRLRHDRPEDLWRGHRLLLIDGSSASMPDTAALQAAFGQPGAQQAGCGFPVAHVLALFEARSGYLLKAVLAPLRTHDLTNTASMHPEMRPGDVLVGDRAFASFGHIAACQARGIHAVMRAHQRRKEHLGASASRDRRVVYAKPQRPKGMTDEQYAAWPERLVVREVRVRVRTPGRRVHQLVLVTTLLDRDRYPAREIARIFERRWAVEVDLRSLKVTLGMDILRSKTEDGIRKEASAFALVYNLVRRVMVEAAGRQEVEVDRVSFVDALRWLQNARPGERVPELIMHPERPGRFEPRVKKRRPKQYRRMTRPRAVLKREILQGLAA